MDKTLMMHCPKCGQAVRYRWPPDLLEKSNDPQCAHTPLWRCSRGHVFGFYVGVYGSTAEEIADRIARRLSKGAL